MMVLRNVLLVVHVIVCVIMTAVVLMQSGKGSGLSGTISGGSDSFFGKNKGRTLDAMLSKLTAALAVLFLVITIALTFVTARLPEATNNAPVDTAPVTVDDGEEVPVEVTPVEGDVDVPTGEEIPAEPDVVVGDIAPDAE